MRKELIVIAFTALTLLSCNTSETTKKPAIGEVTIEINALMNQWHQDAAEANLEDYLGLMHQSSNYIGTDGTENWTKPEFRAFCKPHFDRKKTWDFKTLERNVYLSQTGNTVWFEELLKTALGPCRGSGVLERYDNTWKLKQYVLSMTVANEDSGKVLETKSKSDSLFISRFNE